MKRIAIVTTHPIQYNAPFFKLLSERGRIQVKVFYTWEQAAAENKFDPGFGKNIEWDIPLLHGYEYSFIKNISTTPGSHLYKGIDNPTLIKEIEAWKADAVLIYGWSFKSHLQCIRYFTKKITVLFRGDSTLLDPQPLLKKLMRLVFLHWVYRNIDFALYVGTNNKMYFKKCGVPERKLFFAPHAVDNSRFADDENKNYEKKAAAWRKELMITETDTVFLFAGKLEEKKDPGLLIEVFKKLKQPGIKLIIAGNGAMEQHLKNMAAGNDAIIFLGFQNQSMMPVLYRVADCLVLPSKGPNETWGLAVNEAMASSRPVIASDRCGCAVDLIKENQDGYIFKSNDTNDLLTKMEKFIEEKMNGTDMRNAALKNIQRWNFSEICKSVEKIIA